jgi:DNA-binding PadR family transcriptional regulator
MRDQDFRRHDRHDAEHAGCRPGGPEAWQRDEGEDRRSRGDRLRGEGRGGHRGDRHGGDRHDGEGRGGEGRGGFPGPFPGGPPGFHGHGPWAGERGPRPGDRKRRGSRARRGDTRAAALALLAEQPLNGYQVIQEIGERSGGVWRPSPGSVYPTLQQLQDEGLIEAEPGEAGRRGYVLTDSGREYVSAHPDELRAPWDVVAGGTGSAAIEMRTLMGQLAMAAFQVTGAGTDAQQAQARQVLADSRKALYRLLADSQDEPATQENEPATQEK